MHLFCIGVYLSTGLYCDVIAECEKLQTKMFVLWVCATWDMAPSTCTLKMCKLQLYTHTYKVGNVYKSCMIS